MKIMDHDEAVRLQAAEKYLLGQLPKEQHAAYEEHYFDCSVCAEEIKATAAFMESARQVAREQAPEVVDSKRFVAGRPKGDGWFTWLKPAFAIPVMAALLLFIGYQNGVTIPKLRQGTGGTEVRLLEIHSLRGGAERGEGGQRLQISPGQDYALVFDFTPSQSFDQYLGKLQDEKGVVAVQFRIPGEKTNQEINVPVPAGRMHPGKYTLIVDGDPGPAGKTASKNHVVQVPITVEFTR